MPRDKSSAQPYRKLSEEAWESLRLEVERETSVSVEELCRRKGVTKQRFYKRFPAGQRPGAPSPLSQAPSQEPSPSE